MDIERGWFYLADLNPPHGTEAGKTRPVLVLQTDLLNQHGHPSSIILPVTTNVQDNAEPLRVRVKASSKGFNVDSDIMIDQIRAIDNKRLYKQNSNQLIKKIAPADSGVLTEVENCVKKVLDLP
jgi:mRNA interferase MazF